MVKRSGPRSGPGSGDPSGERSGDHARVSLDLDELESTIALEVVGLADEVRVFLADANGHVPGGARLGRVPLQPLDTLGDRVVDEFGGPATFWVQFRDLGGHIARWARVRQHAYRVPRARVAPTPTAPPPSPAATPPSPFALLREMRDLGLLSSPPSSSSPPPAGLVQQVQELNSAVNALEASGIVVKKSASETPVVVQVLDKVLPELTAAAGSIALAMKSLADSRVETERIRAAAKTGTGTST